MIFVPSLNQDAGFGIGPRDLIHSLSSLLASFRGGNSAVINILQDKLTTLGISNVSPQKLIDISSEDELDERKDGTRRSGTWSDNGAYTLPAPIIPAFPAALDAL